MNQNENKPRNDYIRSFYDHAIQGAFDNDYEFMRWFKTARLRLDYTMMYKAVSHHVSKCQYNSCLELGPGPGTWTRILYRRATEAHFDLVDISKEMHEQFKLEMRESPNVQYHISDFFDFKTDRKYDLFFSSRAIEYIENTEAVLEKIHSLLNEKGKAIIITKNPEHLRTRPASKRSVHAGQITALDMQKKMEDTGFQDVEIYPCTIRIPLIDRLTLARSERVFRKIYKKETHAGLTRLAESYVAIAKK